jgi:hypothetical protein
MDVESSELIRKIKAVLAHAPDPVGAEERLTLVLDNTVHDYWDEIAASINNSGGQVDFLGYGDEDDDLDEAVHDAAGEKAADINNGGTSAQLKFIAEEGGKDDLKHILDKVVKWYGAPLHKAPKARARVVKKRAKTKARKPASKPRRR